MKKEILIFSLLLGSLTISAECMYPFIKTYQDTFYTKQCFDEKGEFVDYKGEGFRAGQEQWITTVMMTKKDMPDMSVPFDTANYPMNRIMRFTDKDSKVEFEQVASYSEPLVKLANSLKYMKDPDAKVFHDITTAITLERGGEYTVNLELQNTTFHHTFDTTFFDYPSLRMFTNQEDTKVGTPVSVQVRYNTGYPYDPASYKDGLFGQLTLTDTAYNVIKKVRKDLTFKTNPLNKKAVIDTLNIEQKDLAPGSYRLIAQTNWIWREGARESDTMIVFVNDTLRLEAAVNKTNFSKGEKLLLDYSLNHGYPYIHTQDSIAKLPYVRINASLADTIYNEFGEVKNIEALLTDTVKIMHDSLSSKTLDYKGQMQFDLSKVPAESLGRNISVNLEVFYDNLTQGKRAFTIKIDKPTGVEEIVEDKPAHRKFIQNGRLYIRRENAVYDILGNKIK